MESPRQLRPTLFAIVLAATLVLSACGQIQVELETPPPTLPPTLAPTELVLPTPSAEPTANPFEGTPVSFSGVSFTLPAGIATGTQNEIVPQTPPAQPNEPVFDVWPQHTKITLQGYPLQGTTYQPQILVFPADEYQKMGSGDPETSLYDPRTMIITLQYILATGNFPAPDAVPNTFPFLPGPSARQVFHAQQTMLTFQNGNGIRYLTQFSQASMPLINNQDLVYTFQGITLDGKYYVSVVMPINLPYLAADYGPSGQSDLQTLDNYPGYISSTVTQLQQPEGEGGNLFAPSVAALDALVQSLLISGQ